MIHLCYTLPFLFAGLAAAQAVASKMSVDDQVEKKDEALTEAAQKPPETVRNVSPCLLL